LDLDEGSDFGAVANFTSIEIDEVVDNNIAAELDVRSDYAELSEHEKSQSGKCRPRLASPLDEDVNAYNLQRAN
jgi:hypothetical protein